MTTLERIFHAVLFEVLAILLSIVAVKLTTSHQTGEITIVIVLISLIAVLWNIVFNFVFDRFFIGARERRSFKLRAFHTLMFEGGLLIFTLPLVAYVLDVDWITAFWTDIGLTLLIIVYTFLFNWVYDHLRLYFIK